MVTRHGPASHTFRAVNREQIWPADPGHREAIDTLLLMAEAEGRWGEPHRAVELFDQVEGIVGALPAHYAAMHRSYREAARALATV